MQTKSASAIRSSTSSLPEARPAQFADGEVDQESQGNLEWVANPHSGGDHALIACEGKAVGYIRWQVATREALDSLGLPDVPANAVDVDLLIGDEQYLGHGIGPAALRELLDRLRVDPSIPLVGLTSSVANVRPHQAFEKAGFRIARQYSPPGLGPCHLFVFPMRVPARVGSA